MSQNLVSEPIYHMADARTPAVCLTGGNITIRLSEEDIVGVRTDCTHRPKKE